MVQLKPPREKALITQSLLAFLLCVNYRFTTHIAKHIVHFFLPTAVLDYEKNFFARSAREHSVKSTCLCYYGVMLCCVKFISKMQESGPLASCTALKKEKWYTGFLLSNSLNPTFPVVVQIKPIIILPINQESNCDCGAVKQWAERVPEFLWTHWTLKRLERHLCPIREFQRKDGL